MKYFTFFPCFLLFLFQLIDNQLVAQQRKQHQKGTFTDSSNRYYQQASLPAYISIGTSPEGRGTVLNPVQQNTPKAMYLDGHGKHFIRHRDATLPNGGLNFEINADGKAPISFLQFSNAPSFTKNGKLYFGQNLTVAIKAKDEMSGINQIYQSTDRNEFTEETQNLLFNREKEYFVQHYAVDNVGNEEKTKEKTFTVDLTAPQTNYTLKGDQIGNVISARTFLSLAATDELAGVHKISYRLGDEALKTYTSALNFAALGDGEHILNYRAIDNVKNQEEENSFSFYLDKMPPIITSEILGDRYVIQGKTFFSGRTKLQLEAIDNKAGVKEIFYSVDGNTYEKYEKPFYIPNRAGHHVVNYYAIDNVNNKGSGKYERTVTSMFMDMTGPSLSFHYTGEKFDMNNTIYISPKTKINLTARDIESGVQNIEYQIDGVETMEYKYPFQLANEGTHNITFTGFDNVNNSNNKAFEFVVDATAPQIFTHFSLPALAEEVKILAGSGKSEDTETSKQNNQNNSSVGIYPKHLMIFLGATDNMTGTDKIFYTLNGNPEQVYQTPLSNFSTGKVNVLKIRAVDKLGNVATEEVLFLVK
jgi:hypothetical protein